MATNRDGEGRGVSAPALGAASALGVCIAAVIGLRLQSDGLAVIWPAAGLGVGLMLAVGTGGRIAVAAGMLLALVVANIVDARPPAAAVIFVTGNLVEAVLITTVLARAGRWPYRLDSLRAVLAFAAATVAVTAAMGVVTALGLTRVGYVSAGVGATAWTWFTSHAVGILAFAPAAMLAPRLVSERLPTATGDVVLGAAAAVLAVTVVGGAAPQSGLAWLVAAGLSVPLAWWVLLGSGARRAAVALGLVATVTVWQTTASAGLFSGAVGAAQGFLAAMSILLLLLGVVRPSSRVPPIPGTRAVRDPALLVLLVPAMLFAATAWWTWLSAASEARLRLGAQTATLAEQAQRVLEVQGALLVAVLGRVEDRSIADLAAARDVQAFLARLAADTSAVDGVLLYDRDSGRVLSASTGFPAPDVDLSDREYAAVVGHRGLHTEPARPGQRCGRRRAGVDRRLPAGLRGRAHRAGRRGPPGAVRWRDPRGRPAGRTPGQRRPRSRIGRDGSGRGRRGAGAGTRPGHGIQPPSRRPARG
jgi:hypothetical protein